MPFTFSHPIFAIPLKAAAPKYISLSGLILGSMSPDFEYFIRLEPYRSIGHTTAGLFLQAIPLSILFIILFHTVIKRPLAEHLPGFFRLDERATALITERKLRDLFTWRHSLIFLISVAIGFCTHVFVDEWTHQPGYFVQLLPFMQTSLFGLPIYRLLQYFFSLAGLMIQFGIILYILSKVHLKSRRSRNKRRTYEKFNYWLIVTITALAVTLAKLSFTTSSNLLGILVVAPISGTVLGIFVASMGARLSRLWRAVA